METVRSADGTAIACERLGSGPPLVLVGGAFQHRAIDASGERLARLLSATATVFRYDRRGRGGSGDTPPYAVAREIEDLAAVLAAAGGSAPVCGSSSGAALALTAAAAGLPIAQLALYEPPYVPVTPPPITGAACRGPVRSPWAEGLGERCAAAVAAGRPADAVALFLSAGARLAPGTVAQLRGAPIWPQLEAVAHTIAYDAAVMGDGRVPAGLLARVTQPVLVLDGGDSPAWLRAAANETAAVLAHAERRTLPGQSHDADPAALAPVLAAAFARWPEPGAPGSG